MSAGPFKNLFGALPFVTVFRVDRDENVALFDFSLVSFCFILWDAHADKGSGQPAHGGTHPGARQRSHDRSRSDKRPDTGNGQRADPNEPSQYSPYSSPSARSSRRAFGSLGVLLVCKISCP